MLNYIFYGIVFIVILWKGKPYIYGLILARQNKKKVIPKVNPDLVYVPVVSSRTFQFAIEITEVGEGKATISVVKIKD